MKPKGEQHHVSWDESGPMCCGEPMVLRRRKSDGHQFHGCARYPKCTQTAPHRSWSDTLEPDDHYIFCDY